MYEVVGCIAKMCQNILQVFVYFFYMSMGSVEVIILLVSV